MEEKKMLQETKRKDKNLYKAVGMVTTMMFSLIAFSVASFAADGDTIWTKLADAMGEIYSKLAIISTAVAVLAAAIAVIMMMVSSNQKTVDSSKQWLKRIVISWLVINSLGYVMNYLSTKFGVGKTETDRVMKKVFTDLGGTT